jgi:hypothetical protein
MDIINGSIGNGHADGSIVLRGKCPFCLDMTTFRQVGSNQRTSKITGRSVALQCDGCSSILAFSITHNKMFPAPMIKGLEDLPEDIDKYYQEGLRCITADAPNGAATAFRKVIHAIGIHYGIATKNDSKNLYEIINELYENGHIIEKLKEALLGVKDIGNDGAHINENEPDIEQCLKLKQLIETVLTSTVICDQNLEFVREKHST